MRRREACGFESRTRHPSPRVAGSSAGEDGTRERCVQHADMTRRTSTGSHRRRRVAVVLAALTAVTLTACSQSAQASTCERMDGVSAAIDNLNNVTVSGNGMVAVKDYLAQMQNQLTRMRSDVSQAAQQQVDAVKTSVQQLQTSVEDARKNPTSASLAAVRNNLQGMRAVVANLRGAVAAGC
jgi:hypothetical protein